MKKIIFAFLLVAAITSSTAQTSLTTAVDFTVTDTGGNTHNLFSILNSGKYVCLDFFYTTCVPCQNTSPFYKQTYINYGCNTQDVFFMSVDYNNTNAEVLAYEQTYLNGNAGYPAISGTQGNGNSVVVAYNILAFPTYILIAPNHQVIETDMWPIYSVADFTAFFNAHNISQKSCLITSLKETLPEVDFGIYPNPAKSEINFTFDEIKKQTIVLNDMYGKEILQTQTESLNYKMDISSIHPGIYFLTVKNTDGEKTKKIVIH